MSDKTKEVIIGMLTENTGTHILDSGGAYGRHWERNQGVDWDNTPRFTVDEYGVTINIYHFLNDNLVFSEDMDSAWRAWDSEHPDGYYWQLMQEWVDEIGGDADPIKYCLGEFNTYNWENDLSQVLQGVVFNYGDSTYVILQVHQGADVRGGYTAPRVFEVVGEAFPYLSTWYLECENGCVVTGGSAGEIYIDGSYSRDTWNTLNESEWKMCPAEDCGGKLLLEDSVTV